MFGLKTYQVDFQYYDDCGVTYNRIETVRAYCKRYAIQKVILKYDVIRIFGVEEI